MRHRLPDHKGQGCADCIGQPTRLRSGLLRPGNRAWWFHGVLSTLRSSAQDSRSDERAQPGAEDEFD